jgi:hypothetical protein
MFKTNSVATFGSVMHSGNCRVQLRNLWRYRASDPMVSTGKEYLDSAHAQRVAWSYWDIHKFFCRIAYIRWGFKLVVASSSRENSFL